jgi:hypothetical protein
MYENIKKVCLYARFSSHNQTEQSIEGQVRVCKEFCRNVIDLFVNSVTVWDEPDGTQKVVIAYNLQSENKKTYRLNSDGKSDTDIKDNSPVLNPSPLIVSEVILHSLSISK